MRSVAALFLMAADSIWLRLSSRRADSAASKSVTDKRLALRRFLESGGKRGERECTGEVSGKDRRYK